MNEAFFTYFAASACGLFAGVSGSVALNFGISRFCRRLSLRLSDIEERLQSTRGKEMAKARWDQGKWAEELAKQAAAEPIGRKRYDNDPQDL